LYTILHAKKVDRNLKRKMNLGTYQY